MKVSIMLSGSVLLLLKVLESSLKHLDACIDLLSFLNDMWYREVPP